MSFRIHLLLALCTIVGAGGISLDAQQGNCFISRLHTVSFDDNIIRELELPGLVEVSTFEIILPGQDINGVRGLAIQPSTGHLFTLCFLASNPNNTPFLMEIDLLNASALIVGPAVLDFVDLAFDLDGTLYGVTSTDTATNLAQFCELSLITGGPSPICDFPGGDGGESIGFKESDQRLYHAAGTSDVRFERENPTGTSACSTINIDISGTPLADGRVDAICDWPSEDIFLWKKEGSGSNFFTVSSTGGVESLGSLDHPANGLAVVVIATPCPPSDLFLRGDANGDLGVNIADAVFLLNSLFVPGSPEVPCSDGGDVNDDGGLNIADAVYLLNALFVPGSSPIPDPNPECGEDPTADGLDCATPPACP